MFILNKMGIRFDIHIRYCILVSFGQALYLAARSERIHSTKERRGNPYGL